MRLKLFASGTVFLSVIMGAEEIAPLGTYTAAERRHWAFQKRSNPEVPKFVALADRVWAKNPIDAFILARLKKEGLRPSAPADRTTLIRRIYFDVTGLPPTSAEIAAFVGDRSPDAYPKLVERLLASPHYGERWAQHWLDVVRYAETEGFEYDTHRKDVWRFRDYVIRAFNDDKPYDRFLMEQIAGDEISPPKDPDDDALIAAGFIRMGPVQRQNGNLKDPFEPNDVLTDMTNVFGSAILGVTLGCARCHDHKFDPIRHTDYYRMQAFFAATHENDVPLATPEEQAAWKAKTEAVTGEVKKMRGQMRGLKGEARTQMEKKLKEIEARMPEPLPAIYTVAN